MKLQLTDREITVFGEDDYRQAIEKEIDPFLKEHAIVDYVTTWDGAKLRYSYVIHPEEKGRVVISHGFCEFLDKFREVIYLFYEMGYSVFFVEHRGHGYSTREIDDLDKVVIKDYDVYVEDFKSFIDQIVCKVPLTDAQGNEVADTADTKQLILYAHSMGGEIGALFLEKYPQYFKKAILSSPLMQMNFGSFPDAAVSLLMGVSHLLRWGNNYVPGEHGFEEINEYETSSAKSKARYDEMFESRMTDKNYRTFGGTYCWVWATLRGIKRLQKDAAKVKIPVLLFQAGQDSMVRPAGQNRFAKEAADVKLIRYEDSKHEVYNATEDIRFASYQAMDQFLNEN